jgi:hypothetical protein
MMVFHHPFHLQFFDREIIAFPCQVNLIVRGIASAACFLVGLVVIEATAAKRRNTVDSASTLLIQEETGAIPASGGNQA